MTEMLLVVPAIVFGLGVGLFVRRRPSARPAVDAVDVDAFLSPTGLAADDQPNAPGWLLGCLDSVEHIALRICETTHGLIGRSTAIILRDPGMHTAAIAAVSPGVDKRLVQVTISPESPAGRACLGAGGLIVMATDVKVLGGAPTVRRREQHGVAVPLQSGDRGVGSLVVFGPPESLAEDDRRRLAGLAREAGPILDRALKKRTEAFQESMDPVVGIRNKRGLAEAIKTRTYPPCALLRVEVEPLDAIASRFGGPAADGARRHAARRFERCLREDDVAAYLQGSSFAILLIECAQYGGEIVARRLNESLADAPFRWDQLDLQLTCTVGIASVPDTVRAVEQLESAAEEALRAQV